jgi:citrate synthase
MKADPETLSAPEAARLLGVKLPTLYSYVSRGLLRSAPGDEGRARRYPRNEVERLLARRRGRGSAIPGSALRFGEPVLESSVTRIGPGGPEYRGIPLHLLLEDRLGFECVAELLWTGSLPEAGAPLAAGWEPRDLGVPVSALLRLLPSGSRPLSALRLVVPALAVADAGRYDVRPEAVLPRGRTLVRRLAAALALPLDPGRVPDALAAPSTAHAVAVALGARPGPRTLEALETALIVCADHELNASTFAARVTASTRADLYACISAALGALSGPLHGGGTEQVEAIVEEIGSPEQAERVMHERLRRGELIPGFGHPLYRGGGDPRTPPLLACARERGTRSRPARALLGLVDAAAGAGRPPANVDVGLVAVCAALGLPPGAPAGVFAVGRCAGWIAHVLEQLEAGFLVRPRARWTGDA